MRFFAVISPALLAALVSLSLPAPDQAKPAFGITSPVMFDTPEADRILSTLQVFPPDNPWNEVIADRPLDPQSGDIVRSIGRDERLGFNLDMNFVIVPPDQPRVSLRVLLYPDESDPGPFPIPDTAPIENWPLTHNEDAAALPKPGMTLSQFQREGSGDRHLIVVDYCSSTGMFVADNGANWLVSIAPDRRIQGLDSLARVKGSDFEVVSTRKDGHAFQ